MYAETLEYKYLETEIAVRCDEGNKKRKPKIADTCLNYRRYPAARKCIHAFFCVQGIR